MPIAVLRTQPGSEPHNQILTDHGSGGLAAVWAEENTRGSIFQGMKRREAYATSGPRIVLRFFAGSGFDGGIVDDPDPVAVAADWMSAPLQRIQIVKGWIDADGETHELVRDVVCADGLEVDPDTNRCPDNDSSVDIGTCQTLGDSGAGALMAAWQDDDEFVYYPN